MRAHRRHGKRSRWAAIACCALVLCAAIGPIAFWNLTPHAQAAVMLSSSDPLLGTPRGTPEKVMRFAQEKQSTRIADTRAYIYEVYRLAPLVGLDPALVIAQSALETANWTSSYWTNYLNPAGSGSDTTVRRPTHGRPARMPRDPRSAGSTSTQPGRSIPGNPLYQYRDVGPTYQRVIDLGYNGQAQTLDEPDRQVGN